MGQEFSGNCDVASRNALLHNGATNATRSRRLESEEAPPCRTRVLGAELDGSLATANFRESFFPRTPVNKSGQASSEARSDYTRRCCRHLRLHWFLLLAMLAGKVLRTVHKDQDNRHHAPQPSAQP